MKKSAAPKQGAAKGSVGKSPARKSKLTSTPARKSQTKGGKTVKVSKKASSAESRFSSADSGQPAPAAKAGKTAASSPSVARPASTARDRGGEQRSSAQPRAARSVKALGNRGNLSIEEQFQASLKAQENEVRLEKTYLTDAELEEFRQILLFKRRQLLGDVARLESEASRGAGSGNGGSSTMPIHMADLGSDTWEQELTLGLIENERGLLREVEQALARIEDKTYGICMATGKPITKARLRAKPWAKYCIEYARKQELGLV